jgi:multiple sugar transport system substrate-binding protein
MAMVPTRKLVPVLVGALAAGALAAGCGSGSGGSGDGTTAVVWHGEVDVSGKSLTALGKKWNAENPKQKVKLVFDGGSDGVLQKTVAGFTAGNYPDMAYQFGSSAAQLVRQPKLVDLTKTVKEPSFGWDDFYPSEQEAATVGDKVVGVPALVDNLAVVYNKKVFQDAGVPLPTATWSWDDFRSAAVKLTDASSKKYGWAYVNDGSEDTVWRYLALLWQAGGELLNSDNTKPAFNSAAGRNSLQLLQDMAVKDKSVYLDNGNGNYLNLFNSGKIAMLWTGPWDLSSINKDVDYGVALLPGYNGNHETISGPDLWMAFDHNAARTKTTLAFMKWLTSPEVHMQYALATGNLPIRKSETQLPEYQDFLEKYPGNKVFVQNLDNVKHVRPNVASYGQISTAIGQMVQSVLIGKADPQEALDTADDAVTSALAGQ